jgi:hypothetical protein
MRHRAGTPEQTASIDQRAERTASARPAVTPEPNPKTKKPILAAKETSFHNTIDKATAMTKKMTDSPISTFSDFMLTRL